MIGAYIIMDEVLLVKHKMIVIIITNMDVIMVVAYCLPITAALHH